MQQTKLQAKKRGVGVLVDNTKERGVDIALRKFKKKIEKLGILDELKDRQYYEKPSVKKHRAKAKSVYNSKKVRYE